MSFSLHVCFAAPPPSPFIPHVCGWIPHAAAWLSCKPLIDSSPQDWTVSSPGVLTAQPQAPCPHGPGDSLKRDGRRARDPEPGLCHPKTPAARGRAGTAEPLKAWCHPSAVLALCPAAVSLLLAALGPFPSLHRNESSLLSSPTGAAGGWQAWHRGRVPHLAAREPRAAACAGTGMHPGFSCPSPDWAPSLGAGQKEGKGNVHRPRCRQLQACAMLISCLAWRIQTGKRECGWRCLGIWKSDAGRRHTAPHSLARCGSPCSESDVVMRSRLQSTICAKEGSLPVCAVCAHVCPTECPHLCARAMACLTAPLLPCPGSPLSDSLRQAPQRKDEPHRRHRCHPDRYSQQTHIPSPLSSELGLEQPGKGQEAARASLVLAVPCPTPA